MKRALLTLPILFALLIAENSLLHGQNQLVQAPDAVKLRRVWTQFGKQLTADEYGRGLWGGADISGDSIADIGVYRRSTNEWLFYRGGSPAPDTIPFFSLDSISSRRPAVGNFWGKGTYDMAFVYFRVEDPEGLFVVYGRPTILDVSSDRILTDSALTSSEHRCYLDMQVHDVGAGEADDMIVMKGCSSKSILFYLGGPDFSLDTPSVVVNDTGLYGPAEYNWGVHFGDFDGDGRLDMVMGGDYPGVGQMIRFYWGDENSPYSWAQRQPDRNLILVSENIGLSRDRNVIPYIEDFDGDGAEDLYGSRPGRPGSEFGQGVYVYLSSRKNARTRSFRYEDADVFYPQSNLGYTVGPLNCHVDSIPYDMLPLGTRYVSGSSTGPDFDYEAWHAQDGIDFADALGRGMPVGDVTGDGWHDAIEGNENYGPFVSTGIAMILAGGPYIPFDDPTVSVREEPVAGVPAGLFLWPNPIVDELHIAWRGDLGAGMPRRLEIYDMAGRLIVTSPIDPSLGTAVWQCNDVDPGAYLLIGYDGENRRITEARILKR